MAFLLYVMHAMSYFNVGDKLGISKSAACQCVHECTTAILEHMYRRYIHLPSPQQASRDTEQWSKITRGIPGIIGAIDCTEILIRRPLSNAEDFLNRHGRPAIKVQALVDVRQHFIDIDTGWPGSCGDSLIFHRSALGKMHREYLQQFGTTSVVTSEDAEGLPVTEDIPAFILADAAYASTREMVPTSKKSQLQAINAQLNERLSAGRAVVEQTFGTLKQRFRILKQPLLSASEDFPFAVRLIAAILVIHNFLKDSGDEMTCDLLELSASAAEQSSNADSPALGTEDVVDVVDGDDDEDYDEEEDTMESKTKHILLRRLDYLNGKVGNTKDIHFVSGANV